MAQRAPNAVPVAVRLMERQIGGWHLLATVTAKKAVRAQVRYVGSSDPPVRAFFHLSYALAAAALRFTLPHLIHQSSKPVSLMICGKES